MHKKKYLHGFSYYRKGDADGEWKADDADDGAMEWPATLSTLLGNESKTLGSDCENQEPMASGLAPGVLALLCAVEIEPMVTVCVWESLGRI